MIIFYKKYLTFQKEHSNIISNLRATNDLLFTVSEQPSNSIENIEENKIDGPVVRMRKKGTVEMHPPNILVQPSSPLLQVKDTVNLPIQSPVSTGHLFLSFQKKKKKNSIIIESLLKAYCLPKP